MAEKDINYYMSLPYEMKLIPENEFGGYVITISELPGCLSRGDDLYEAIANFKEAKELWFKTALEDGIEISRSLLAGNSSDAGRHYTR